MHVAHCRHERFLRKIIFYANSRKLSPTKDSCYTVILAGIAFVIYYRHSIYASLQK